MRRSHKHRIGRRHAWIEAAIRYTGRLDRRTKTAIMQLFGISDNAISKDQAAVVARMNAEAGVEAVRIICGKAILAEPRLIAAATGDLPGQREFLSEVAGGSMIVVEDPRQARTPDDIFRDIAMALSDRRPVVLDYVSRSSGRSRRTVSPHTIVHVAGRFHVRAFCHAKNEGRDFVLPRIVAVRNASAETAYISQQEDVEWSREVTLRVAVCGSPDPEIRHMIVREYGLGKSGERRMRVRRPLAPYLVDKPVDPNDPFQDPISISYEQRTAE